MKTLTELKDAVVDAASELTQAWRDNERNDRAARLTEQLDAAVQEYTSAVMSPHVFDARVERDALQVQVVEQEDRIRVLNAGLEKSADLLQQYALEIETLTRELAEARRVCARAYEILQSPVEFHEEHARKMHVEDVLMPQVVLAKKAGGA